MYTKQELRKLVAERKNDYDVATKHQKSECIFQQLKDQKEFIRAKTVLCYWSMPDEVYTHNFVVELSKTKQVFLPVVDNNDLLIREFSQVESLRKGTLSIMEPSDSANHSLSRMDLVIVPGIAFDRQGGRLGRGKGYYDRLLATADVFKIGVCFDYQLLDQVPCDHFDVRMDKVITI